MAIGNVENSHELCQYRRKIRGFKRFFEIWHMRMDYFQHSLRGIEKSQLVSDTNQLDSRLNGVTIYGNIRDNKGKPARILVNVY